ncbi:hypothetical protein [Arthrobacter globiformis]|uniref:hypothetical protein n=1 Tax=Arthrobacter globiformis TaxID=1665 RepID=UPI00278CC505|nr:hypothetical protein [Arthrobacter globiformis]MDQ0616995.1 hypothetical protein [Arthrobacter globiformis]
MTITDRASGTPPHPPLRTQPHALQRAGAAGPAPAQTRHTRRAPIDTATTEPVLDVTIPVYNEERDLEECLRRLHAYLRGTFPHSFRITVADNASTGGGHLPGRDHRGRHGLRPVLTGADYSRRKTAGRPSWPVSTEAVTAV